jgi:TolB protein
MPDVQEVFRLATNKVKPDPDALERQVRRQRAEARKSRIRAYVAVAAVLVLLGTAIFALSHVVGRTGSTPESGAPASTRYTFQTTLISTVTPQKADLVDTRGNTSGAVPNVPVQAYAPSLSTDGSTVAFIDAPTELRYNQVAVMNADGTDAHFVPTLGIIVDSVAISPDASRIAFAGTKDGLDDIYVMNADGSDLLQLTNDPATDQFPQWSPDGRTIVYDNAGSDEDVQDPQYSKTAEIYSVSSTGGDITRLTNNNGYDAAPSFSPDGAMIVAESAQGLSLMDANGTRYRQLANVDGFTPRFSPDGKTVAFSYFSNNWRPDVQLGGNYSPSAPLCLLGTADVRTGHVSRLANVAMATDLNTPQWMSGERILVMRVPAHNPGTH